jgi:hypothetical protein
MVVRPSFRGAYRAVIEAQPNDLLLTTVSGSALYGDPTILAGVGQALVYTNVDACGEQRQLAVADKPTAETLDQITDTFFGDGVENVIPLFQCTAAPESAFH